MQDTLRPFVKDLLTQKDLGQLDAEVIEQLLEDLTSRLNTQINRAILAKLQADDLTAFENLLKAHPSKVQVDAFFKDKNIDTTTIATEVMSAFRNGYLGV